MTVVISKEAHNLARIYDADFCFERVNFYTRQLDFHKRAVEGILDNMFRHSESGDDEAYQANKDLLGEFADMYVTNKGHLKQWELAIQVKIGQSA